MKLLTFDTCLNKTFVSLSEDNKILSSKIIVNTDEKYHSAFLMPTIVGILKENNITMQDIKAIGTNIGPGSFTGIRVCVVVARVFAQQLNAKLIGIPSMQILSKINTTQKDSLVLMDARKNNVYCAIYSPNNQEIQPPCIIGKEDILKSVQKDYFIISDTTIYEYLKENEIESINYETGNFNPGEYLASLTYKKIAASPGDNFNWAKLKPLYIQQPSISKPKER